jgi:arsenical pump membrane protein
MRFEAAFQQAWPAFVLVTGLLLVGLVANSDGLFAQAGRLLERLPGPPLVLLIAGMMLLALVTAVLNLDTSVVFLTPILVYAARHRGVAEEPFLYSAIFMSNASSLYLPGSNLTNLLVLAHEPISGGAFARGMLAPALAATLVTAAGLLLLFRRLLGARASSPLAATRSAGSPGCPAGSPVHPTGLGLVVTIAAGLLTVLLGRPALPVLAVGLVGVTVQILRERLRPVQAIRAVGPAVLGGLFALSVLLGVLARAWDGPAQLLGQTGRWGTAAIGALAAIAINNLPAAVLLSARPLAHPRALLIGLNLGPNLAVSGSLSAYLWLKVARQIGERPSIITFTRRGAVLAPLALIGALLALGLLSSSA